MLFNRKINALFNIVITWSVSDIKIEHETKTYEDNKQFSRMEQH